MILNSEGELVIDYEFEVPNPYKLKFSDETEVVFSSPEGDYHFMFQIEKSDKKGEPDSIKLIILDF